MLFARIFHCIWLSPWKFCLRIASWCPYTWCGLQVYVAHILTLWSLDYAFLTLHINLPCSIHFGVSTLYVAQTLLHPALSVYNLYVAKTLEFFFVFTWPKGLPCSNFVSVFYIVFGFKLSLCYGIYIDLITCASNPTEFWFWSDLALYELDEAQILKYSP